MIPPINNDINTLNKNFRVKFDARWKEVTAKYPNAVVFEAQRSQERQNRLYAQGRTRPGNKVTWTLESNHKNGNAVDIVFRNNWKLERAGPYDDLIEMAKKYGIRNLKPKETCHFEDDWTPYNPEPRTIWTATEDMVALYDMQNDKIRSGETGSLDERTLIIIARVYKKLKTLIEK